MAYMSQEKKAAIVAELKKVIPQDWKWSVAVENHSGIRLTVASAPIDLIGEMKNKYNADAKYIQLNNYHLDNAYDGELLKIFENINAAMNLNNFDNSDIMSDYHSVGHYVYINLGKWNKPFVVK